MKPPPPRLAFSGSVGKNAVRKESRVKLQPLDSLLLILLLDVLRELARRSLSEGGTRGPARLSGEKH